MLAIPSALQSKFEERLRNESIPNNLKGQYKKWLQYYLDFCSKYHFPHIDKNSLPRFILKLQEKKQTTAQQEQASIAITLYYEIQNTAILPDKVTPPQPASHPASITFNDKTHLSLRERGDVAQKHQNRLPRSSFRIAIATAVPPTPN